MCILVGSGMMIQYNVTDADVLSMNFGTFPVTHFKNDGSELDVESEAPRGFRNC